MKCISSMRRKKGPKNRYKIIEQELVDSPEWPPLGEVVLAAPPSAVASVAVRDAVTVPVASQ